MGDQAAFGALLGFGIFGIFLVVFLLILIPFVLYLRNLQQCLNAVRPEFRPDLPTALIWLALVPGLGFIILIAAVVMLSTALKKEDQARQSAAFGDGGLALGLAAAILGVLSFIPFLGVLLALASLVCWIMHWLKVSGFRKTLAALEGAPFNRSMAPPPPPAAAPGYMAPPPPPPFPTANVPPPPPAAPPPVPTAVAVENDATVHYQAAPKVKLVAILGPLSGMSFPLTDSGSVIGRHSTADISLNDGQISGRHAWVGMVNGKPVVRDQGSTNGTYLNDQLNQTLSEAELKDGDLLILGKHDGVKFKVVFE